MKTYDFSFILNSEPDEAAADALYGILNDGSLATIAGIAQVDFHREAESLESAIRSALADIRRAKLDVLRVEVSPEAFAQPA